MNDAAVKADDLLVPANGVLQMIKGSGAIMSNRITAERAGSINGVHGRFFQVVSWPNGLLANQKWLSETRTTYNGRMHVEIRHDDGCKNGHESFAITATIKGTRGYEAGGCLHDEIRIVFPELVPLIQWHLVSTDGPMHGDANGWYWLAGAVGGLEQQYHGGNDSSERTPDDCVRIFADHFAMPESEARQVIGHHADLARDVGNKSARAAFALWVADYLPGMLTRFRIAVESAGFIYANEKEAA